LLRPIVADASSETALRRASREFPRVLVDSPRMWLWATLWGLAGTGLGVYFSFGHGRTAQVAIVVGTAAAGLLTAVATAWVGLWTTAPLRSLRENVAGLRAEVTRMRDRDPGSFDSLRVALFAVRN